MTTEESRWVQAGVVLGSDASIEVQCPRCSAAILEVYDVRVGSADSVAVERHMTCPRCGATNSLLFHKPPRIAAPPATLADD